MYCTMILPESQKRNHAVIPANANRPAQVEESIAEFRLLRPGVCVRRKEKKTVSKVQLVIIVDWIVDDLKAKFFAIHGQRTLTTGSKKDLRQVFFVPAAAAASHGDAEFVGNLF